MTSAKTYNEDRIVKTNIVQLDGHIFQGNMFRSRRPRLEGSPVLIGRIRNRYEVFTEDAESHDNGACFPVSPKE
jgi:hypothetical protein